MKQRKKWYPWLLLWDWEKCVKKSKCKMWQRLLGMNLGICHLLRKWLKTYVKLQMESSCLEMKWVACVQNVLYFGANEVKNPLPEIFQTIVPSLSCFVVVRNSIGCHSLYELLLLLMLGFPLVCAASCHRFPCKLLANLVLLPALSPPSVFKIL